MKCKHADKKAAMQGNPQASHLVAVIIGALTHLSGMAHTVAFRMGWWDKEREHGQVAASMHQGISTFYTRMENTPEELQHRQGMGWKMSEEGKPVGPAVALAGVVLNIADYCSFMGWDLGGAVIAQLNFLSGQIHPQGVKEKEEAR